MSDPERSYPEIVIAGEPNTQTLGLIDQFFGHRDRAELCIAEIGIHVGATTKGIAEFLGNKGGLHIFDFDEKAQGVAAHLRKAGFDNIQAFGSTYRYLDSYNWSLMKVLFANPEPIYDYVFLDGAHTFVVDALAFLLSDRLLKVGGFVDFDDYDWTLGQSPSLNPAAFPLTAKMYTDEQINVRQVAMLVDLLVRRDPRYIEIVPNKLFQKVA